MKINYSRIRVLFVIALLLLSAPLFAHGDLPERIEKKTKEILKNPMDYRLYYERGLLYQQHMEYNKALKDYSKSKYLGNNNKILQYRISEVYYLSEEYDKALKSITSYLEIDNIDVKAKKLQAQILFNQKQYKKSLDAYSYVVNNMIDIRPEDILEYANIILVENNKNYKAALNAIELGLRHLGADTFSLQLKKLEYLKDANQTEEAIQQYNYFIDENQRKEFWYYEKANYLAKIDRPEEAMISLKLASLTIDRLNAKYQNMKAIITLKEQIKNLENSFNN
ncbi:lipopolysaccharide assembly protein LapB [Wenyingzhuangia sp. 2_MG-2023]|uniref:tetratricopeptide repeat protein n=1 Tax=Wenyingzhuangia sp. 2_MG-2023 TaxID=3062639 RepID=UPI0026E38E8A|nr:hypothetical protein [Wenyingzhuangia sp. 2_MG-2023]MDO6739409.1 hypothetical protein [Wenyingzhuangia sp. 2_MG-2023]